MWFLAVSYLLVFMLLACIGTSMLLQRSQGRDRAGFVKLMLWIFRFVFGCHHRQLSRVFTLKKRTYQVCFKCGQEFEYSWALMRSLQLNAAANACVPQNSARAAEAPVV